MNVLPSTIAALAFDLDGTLVDSAPDIQHALNAALSKSRLPAFDLVQVRSWIGDGPDALISRALAAHGVTDPEPGFRQHLRRSFDMATLAAPLAFGSVFPGVMELVTSMHRVLPMVVVSNKPTPLARAVLDAAALLPYFSAVHGADTPAQRKPAPTMLLSAAQALGLAPDQLLMIGDAAPDLLAAQAAGCPAILADWGGYGCDSLPPGLQAAGQVATPMALQRWLMQAAPQRQALIAQQL